MCNGRTTLQVARRLRYWPVLLAAFLFLSGQAAPPGYRGDIRESDPRVREIFAGLRKNANATPPSELRLRYSGPRGDYLAFYDLEGRDIYFRYREDRFDRRAEKRIRELISGQAYRVSGKFQGVLLNDVFFPTGSTGYVDAVQAADALLAYSFDTAFPLRLEQILY